MSVASTSITICRGGRSCRLHEHVGQERIDLIGVAVDLVVPRGISFRLMFQTIERALAGNRLEVRPQYRFELASQHRKDRVLAQFVMIVEVLVAEHQSENALPDQRLNAVLDVARVTSISEALRKPPHQPKATVHLP